jgi:DNA-binding CsgD family transcriptional regulator
MLLLERDAELARLSGAFLRAGGGEGSLLLVEGAPGVGKSRLLDAARSLAEAQGMEVVAATGRELECEFPFGVVLQLFESRLARAGIDERARLLSGPTRLATPLFAGEGHSGGPSGGQAFSVLHGLYWLTANLAEERPLLLCIDDADWADELSLRFILYTAHRIGEHGITVVLARRSAERGPRSDLLTDIASHSATTILRLRSLTRRAVGEFLRASLFPDADDEFCGACFDATKGNPFLLRELAVELASRKLEPSKEAAREIAELVPEGVANAILLRVRGLGPAALELTRAVAVLGDDCELRHAGALAGLPPTEAARLADELVGADVLLRGERLAFVHPIVRAAVDAERSPWERAQAHRRAAELLWEEHEPPERIAAHLMLARRSGGGWAVDTLCHAAARALDRGSPHSAVRYLRRALEEPPTREQRGRVMLELGRAEAVAGASEAVGRLTEAMELIDDRRDRARTALEIGRILYARGRHREGAATFQRGLGDLEEHDPQLGLQLQAAYSTVARLGLPLEERDLGAFPPSVLGSGAGKTAAERVLLAHLAFERALVGEPREQVRSLALRSFGHGDLLAEETSDGIGYYLAAFALTVAEDLQAAELVLAAAVDDARRRGSVLGFATASHFRALAVARRGRMSDAAADIENALSAERYGWRLAAPAARAILAEAMVERGELDAALEQLRLTATGDETGWDLSGFPDDPANPFLPVRGRLRLLQKKPQQALDDFLECGRRQEAIGALNPAVIAWRSGAAVASAALGDLSEARRLLGEELRNADAFGAPGTRGRALRALGAVERGGASLEALQRAVEVLDTSQAALERARGLVDYGAALRRSNRRRDAREPLRAGLDLAERCGSVLLARRAAAELAAAGGRRRRALSGIDSLSPREREVARLAADGLSNREIAEALFVTVKTVEWHLRHAFDKLGIDSRRRLSAMLARSGEPR